MDEQDTQPVSSKLKKPIYRRVGFIVAMIVLALLLLYVVFSIIFAFIVVKFDKFDVNSFMSENQNIQTDMMASYDDSIYTDDDPSLGYKNAPFQIVEFSDFGCLFCSQSAVIMKRLLNKYPQMFHLIYRDFPIDSLHPQSRLVAQAGECADDQGKFWQLHDKIFANQNNMELDDLLNYAKQAGLNMNFFGECLSSGKYQSEVQDDFMAGINAGVEATPTFFINGDLVDGVIPFEVWEKLIDEYNQYDLLNK